MPWGGGRWELGYGRQGIWGGVGAAASGSRFLPGSDFHWVLRPGGQGRLSVSLGQGSTPAHSRRTRHKSGREEEERACRAQCQDCVQGRGCQGRWVAKAPSAALLGITSPTVSSSRCTYSTSPVLTNPRPPKGSYHGLPCDLLEMGFGVLSGTLAWLQGMYLVQLGSLVATLTGDPEGQQSVDKRMVTGSPLGAARLTRVHLAAGAPLTVHMASWQLPLAPCTGASCCVLQGVPGTHSPQGPFQQALDYSFSPMGQIGHAGGVLGAGAATSRTRGGMDTLARPEGRKGWAGPCRGPEVSRRPGHTGSTSPRGTVSDPKAMLRLLVSLPPWQQRG